MGRFTVLYIQYIECIQSEMSIQILIRVQSGKYKYKLKWTDYNYYAHV